MTHRLLVILAVLVFIGGIIFACFSYNNPSGMMSQSFASDWEPSNQAFLAGLLAGLVTGMTFIILQAFLAGWLAGLATGMTFIILGGEIKSKNKKEVVEKGREKVGTNKR
jgi:hypothetical protein